MTAEPRRIRKLRFTRIDRVGAGAQPDAHVTLVKRRDVAKGMKQHPFVADQEDPSSCGICGAPMSDHPSRMGKGTRQHMAKTYSADSISGQLADLAEDFRDAYEAGQIVLTDDDGDACKPGMDYPYVAEIYAAYLIVSNGGDYWQIPYARLDGDWTFGAAVPVEPSISYNPIAKAATTKSEELEAAEPAKPRRKRAAN